MWATLIHYLNPHDGRFEDLLKGNWRLNLVRDFTAGLIVAMVAIPLAMGFAMASGLRPEQGIVGGAVAGLVGALWGGSKYQVYGPTAAFIPLIAAVMAKYDHSMLVLVAICSGLILAGMGLAKLGRIVALVPHSIVVGFTIGISATIALSQIGDVMGLQGKLGYKLADKLQSIWAHRDEVSIYPIAIALGTFGATRSLLKVSVFIPAPLLAIGAGTLITSTVWASQGLTTVADRYGKIPTNFMVFTPPAPLQTTPSFLMDLAYFTVAVVFVAAVESLLCSRMADRLAENKGKPYDPNKELWGQGLVSIFIPLLNGFPHTGALARTATNIKVGALSPAAGVFKCVLKLLLAAFLASLLEKVPMACLGGIMLYVATAMVKRKEIDEAIRHGRFHVGLMIYTAGMVIATDFLTGVLSAIILYAILRPFFEKTTEPVGSEEVSAELEPATVPAG